MGATDIVRMNVLLAVFLLSIGTVHSIKCYRCNSTDSTHPFQCTEFLTDDIDLQPQSCDDVFGAQYCVKHVGRFEGGIGTKRYCSSKHLGNYCDYVKQPGDKLTYRTCVFTCTGDGCNPASTTKPYLVGTLLVPVGVLAIRKLANM